MGTYVATNDGSDTTSETDNALSNTIRVADSIGRGHYSMMYKMSGHTGSEYKFLTIVQKDGNGGVAKRCPTISDSTEKER